MLNLQHDPDVVPDLRFVILPGKNSRYFSMEREYGLLRVNGTFDRETGCPRRTSCVLELDVAVVEPATLFQIIKVEVIIRDLNDNSPEFPSSRVKLLIPESSPLGRPGFSIEGARDRDTGQLGVQRYALRTESSLFDLNAHRNLDGSFDLHLILNGSLDHETDSEHYVTIVAYDGGTPAKSGSVIIEIEVTDANDNSPRFAQSSYDKTILEDISPMTAIIQVEANDPDQGMNGAIEYSFASESQELFGQIFRIDNVSGEIFLQSGMNYALEEEYDLVVQAQDQGEDALRDFCQVHVMVEDVNNHSPIITVNTLTPTENAQVKENTPRGAFVAHIKGDDQDRGQNGQVACTLDDGNFQLISLLPSEYKIISSVTFDREIVASYDINIVCQDGGHPALQSTRKLVVNIIDENDHSPVFSHDSYTQRVTENSPPGLLVATMTASDRDSGKNANVTYDLVNPQGQTQGPDLVKIDPLSGVITTLVSLDREAYSRHLFRVIAMDGGSPQQSSTTTLTLSIDDVNDEAPVFSQSAYSFGTFENQGNGTEIGMLSAHDLDLPPFNTYEFALMPMKSEHYGTFHIDIHSGRITTRRVLDREVTPAYYLNAIVFDKLKPELSSSVSVTVYVADRNDNSPSVSYPNPSNRTTEVSYFAPVGYIFTKVIAYDNDLGSNAKLNFALTSGNEDGLFDIDPSIGAIFINNPLHVFDAMYPSSVKNVYLLTITISDSGSPPRSTSTLLHIDVNRSKTQEQSASSSLGYHQKIIVILGAVTAILVVILVAAIIMVKRRQMQHSKTEYMRESTTYISPGMATVSQAGDCYEKDDTMIRSTQELPLCPAYPGSSLPPYAYYPTPRNQLTEDKAEQLQELFTKEQDAQSGCSGEVSNADSGHGPSEEGEPHGTSHAPLPPPRAPRGSLPRGKLDPPGGIAVAHARPLNTVRGPYYGVPLETFQSRNNSLNRSDRSSKPPPPVPRRMPVTKLTEPERMSHNDEDDDNMSEGGSSTSGSFTLQLDDAVRAVDV
ncbi:hypothetical protein CAPTEDRAFT_156034 [Capitella teleta]|uniref:Cadherin domain-containing protein n=1 Tax=Capitella teleta TaxID=283909 RepID=R7UDD1_CAPTE|nr:hypothetical protein CAPTEDRAFT_156034 [Capitella teleta]|eukprot:ELU04390.1 hypothetical protein CAPTEDRAFT_156034 [Capitella teleta]